MQWRSVLRSAYAMQSYNASVRGPVTAPHLGVPVQGRAPAAFKDERLPRSYLRCLRSVRRSLLALPRRQRPLRLCNAGIAVIRATDLGRLGEPGQHPKQVRASVRYGAASCATSSQKSSGTSMRTTRFIISTS